MAVERRPDIALFVSELTGGGAEGTMLKLAAGFVERGFANVVAEALACGASVVATDCPSGPSEILDGGRYGRLVPVGDEMAMARAIRQAISRPPPDDADPAWLRRFSREASVDAYFDVLGF